MIRIYKSWADLLKLAKRLVGFWLPLKVRQECFFKSNKKRKIGRVGVLNGFAAYVFLVDFVEPRIEFVQFLH